MQAESIDRMFDYRFEKPSAAIVEKAKQKVEKLQAKIEERQARIAKIRAEYDITDAAHIDILTQARQQSQDKMTYTYNPSSLGNGVSVSVTGSPMAERTIGAGIVNLLLTETDFIEAEKKQVQRLGLLIRNLVDVPDERIHSLTAGTERPMRGHVLSYKELEYLDF